MERKIPEPDRADTEPDVAIEEILRRGNAHFHAGRYAEAEADYRRVLTADPNRAEAFLDLGYALERQGRLEEAERAFRDVLEISPSLAKAWLSIGQVNLKRQRFDHALSAYRKAVELDPESAEAWLSLGNALRVHDDLDGAVDAFLKAVEVKPDFAFAYVNLANTYRAQNRIDESLQACRAALAIDPQLPAAHLNASIAHLVVGNLLAGWPEAEHRYALGTNGTGRLFACPQWKGAEPLTGRRILLHAEQGYGDTLQFLCFVAPVVALGATVFVEVQRDIVPVVRRCPGVKQVLAYGDPIPEIDFHCSLMSLPLAFRTEMDTIPSQVPYLWAPEGSQARWAERFANELRPRIGIAWSGDPRHPNDRNRSVPLEAFRRIFDGFAGARFFSLKKHLQPEEARLLAESGVVDLASSLDDFGETAAAAQQMDLIISVDSSVAHLAGALGCPLWVLVAFSPDWRWFMDREDSPWYPTARLFRQQIRGDWTPVLQQVREELDTRYGG